MTPTLVRLVVLAALVAMFGVALFVWQARGGESIDGAAFRDQASAICRESFPEIRQAPDLQTAVAANQGMRARLAALTPPAAQQSTFDAWLLALEGAETAAVSGNRAAVTAFDGRARNYATTLGVSQACIQEP
jgi:hypothetical protein